MVGRAMSAAIRVAAALMSDTWACPAAILVALVDDPSCEVLPGDAAHLGTLGQRGCLSGDKVTPFGQRVAMVLRTQHGLQARLRNEVT